MTQLPQFTHPHIGLVKLGLVHRTRKSVGKIIPFSSVVNASTAAYPPVWAWERKIDWEMLGNDSLGLCAEAAVMHQLMGVTTVAHAGSPFIATTAQTISLYSAATGYNPADPSTDQGTDMVQLAQFLMANGAAGHAIPAATAIDVNNLDQIKLAAYLFGGVQLGIAAPSYILQVAPGSSWSPNQNIGADSSIAGGHAIYLVGYGRQGFRVVSWGVEYTFDVEFWNEYVQQAIGLVMPDWIKQSGMSPSGVNLESLISEAQLLQSAA
jgi:hypothetical protein